MTLAKNEMKAFGFLMCLLVMSSCAKTFDRKLPEAFDAESVETREAIFEKFSIQERSYWRTAPSAVEISESFYFLNNPMYEHIRTVSPEAYSHMKTANFWTRTSLGLLVGGIGSLIGALVADRGALAYVSIGLSVGSLAATVPATLAVQRGSTVYNQDLRRYLNLEQTYE